MTTGEWPSEKKKPTADRPLALLHQLARDIVDRRDVVGVDRVTQTETVGEQRRAEQHRIVAQGDEGPEPDEDIRGDRERVETRLGGAHVRVAFIPDAGDESQA